MHDYQPLDLSQFCNVGTKFIREGAEPLIGVQTWHGLPFMVGSASPDPARCFIGFGDRAGAGEAVTIRVDAAARYVIFAHALLESRVRELHPYDTPEFLAIPVSEGSHDYLAWISDNTSR